jgi:beta-glucosidase-like glycosyl hydrolase
MNYYQFMVTRLNGREIRERFSYYRSLVRKGVAGFIVFGGELETVRVYIQKLQEAAEIPLIVSSDLERGLGQQLNGGTHFPPAMALAAAYKNRLKAKGEGQRATGKGPKEHTGRDLAFIRKSFAAVAEEAKYAGINTIFAPVLDINTNPENPIIAGRAFGEEPGIVSLLGTEMIRTLQKNGISACGKHFPGHGDTSIDSHIQLPVLKQDMARLRQYELKPFMAAVAAGVRMLMLGHLGVPAIDPSGIPVSFSEKAVQFIRRSMGYDGILLTDALNMGGIGRFSEQDASRRALEAGLDILLHPSDPDRLSMQLAKAHASCRPDRLLRFRKRLRPHTECAVPSFDLHQALSRRLTEDAISVTGRCRIKGIPLVVILNDEEEEKGGTFIRSMGKSFPGTRAIALRPRSHRTTIRKGPGEFMVIAIFSETKAWKGGASAWLHKQAAMLRQNADLYVSFGSPYLLNNLGKVPRICAFWDTDQAQEAVTAVLKGHCREG